MEVVEATEGLAVRAAVAVELAGLTSGFLARVLVVEGAGRVVVEDVGRIAVRAEAAVGTGGFVIPALARAATVLVVDVVAGRAVPEDVVLSEAAVVVLGRVLDVAVEALGLVTTPLVPGLVDTGALDAIVVLAAVEEAEAGFEVEDAIVLTAVAPGLTGAREGRESRADAEAPTAALGGGVGLGAPAGQ